MLQILYTLKATSLVFSDICLSLTKPRDTCTPSLEAEILHQTREVKPPFSGGDPCPPFWGSWLSSQLLQTQLETTPVCAEKKKKAEIKPSASLLGLLPSPGYTSKFCPKKLWWWLWSCWSPTCRKQVWLPSSCCLQPLARGPRPRATYSWKTPTGFREDHLNTCSSQCHMCQLSFWHYPNLLALTRDTKTDE